MPKKCIDSRGELVVFKDHLPGQVYFVKLSGKGIVRGDHYHKITQETVGVIYGEVLVEITDIETREKYICILSNKNDKYQTIDILPNYNHKFKSLSDEACILSYADTTYDAKDTYKMKGGDVI